MPSRPSAGTPAKPPITAARLLAEVIAIVREQHIVEPALPEIGLAMLQGLEAIPPTDTIRVVAASHRATIVHTGAAGRTETISVSLPADSSPLELASALEMAAKFVAQQSGGSVEDTTRAMIRGLSGLDPDGAYADPAEYAELTAPGPRAGIGLELMIRDGALTIVSVHEGSPGEHVGLKAGDRVLRIDTASTEGLKLAEAARRLRGSAGSVAILRVARPEWAEPRDLLVIREALRAQSVESKALGPRQGYIRISRFQDGTGREVQAALDALRAAGAEAVVLDLRGNSGGLVTAAIEVAELFLPEGRLVVYTRSRVRKQNMRFSAHAKQPNVDTPLAVLVDERTAAGAEIVAAALQAWKRTTLVGTRTLGRTSIQKWIPLSDHSALKLTTARWFTPESRDVTQRGLTPNVEVASRAADDRFLRDPTRDDQLRRAMETVGPASAR